VSVYTCTSVTSAPSKRFQISPKLAAAAVRVEHHISSAMILNNCSTVRRLSVAPVAPSLKGRDESERERARESERRRNRASRSSSVITQHGNESFLSTRLAHYRESVPRQDRAVARRVSLETTLATTASPSRVDRPGDRLRSTGQISSNTSSISYHSIYIRGHAT